MFDEDDLLPLSALQHLLYCDRQAALIHIERIWLDNALTIEGQHLHRVVDSSQAESREGVVIRRGVTLRSARLGLSGRADVVEFHASSDREAGISLPGIAGRWKPVPVEYKRGKPKQHRADEVQLCAQALCLEEALGVPVPTGVLFYGQTRRRRAISIDSGLRVLTEDTARRLHELMRAGKTPVRDRSRKCERCSLLPACLPRRRTAPRSARAYIERALGVDNLP